MFPREVPPKTYLSDSAQPPAPSPSPLSQRLVDRVRGQGDNLLTRWADLIKDLMLDWDFGGDEDDGEVTIEDLPPLSEEAFVQAMRGKVEEALRRTAELINQAPTGQIVASTEERMCRLLAELWTTALQLGVQMRLEAAEVEMPPSTRPQGEWARKLRRMLAGGVELPLASTSAERPSPSGNSVTKPY